METLQSKQVESSELFTPDWGFPALHPQLNQPNLVAAIVVMCAGAPPKWIMNWERFAESCFIPKFRTYSRKPNGDQNLSADEIVGYCLLAALGCRLYDGLPYQVRRILRTMKENFGIYPNELGEVKIKRWMYRHIYLVPAMKARGIGPKLIFTSHYMNEFPTMHEIAPVEF